MTIIIVREISYNSMMCTMMYEKLCINYMPLCTIIVTIALADYSCIASTVALVGIRAILGTLRQRSFCSSTLEVVVTFTRKSMLNIHINAATKKNEVGLYHSGMGITHQLHWWFQLASKLQQYITTNRAVTEMYELSCSIFNEGAKRSKLHGFTISWP